MGGSARTSGIAFATFSLVATALMASPLHRIMDARSRALTVVCGLGFLGVSSLIMAALGVATAALFPAMVVFGLGFGLLFPSLSVSVAEQAGSARGGTAFGIFYAVYSLGVFIGAVVSGGVSGAFADLGARSTLPPSSLSPRFRSPSAYAPSLSTPCPISRLRLHSPQPFSRNAMI